jgi:hypothetical protein
MRLIALPAREIFCGFGRCTRANISAGDFQRRITAAESKPWVNGTGSAAVRGVAGDIFKKTFFVAAWADFRGRLHLHGIAAFTAFPEGFGTFWLGCSLLSTHTLLLFFDAGFASVPIPHIDNIIYAKQQGDQRPSIPDIVMILFVLVNNRNRLHNSQLLRLVAVGCGWGRTTLTMQYPEHDS